MGDLMLPCGALDIRRLGAKQRYRFSRDRRQLLRTDGAQRLASEPGMVAARICEILFEATATDIRFQFPDAAEHLFGPRQNLERCTPEARTGVLHQFAEITILVHIAPMSPQPA